MRSLLVIGGQWQQQPNKVDKNKVTGIFSSSNDTQWAPTGSVVVHDGFQPTVNQKVNPRMWHTSLFIENFGGAHIPTHLHKCHCPWLGSRQWQPQGLLFACAVHWIKM